MSIKPERGGLSTEPSGGGREEGLKICRTPMGLWGPLGALSGAMSIDMMRGYRGPGDQGGSFLRNEIGRRDWQRGQRGDLFKVALWHNPITFGRSIRF